MFYGYSFVVMSSLLIGLSTGCSFNVSKSSGNLTSPNYPGQYKRNMDCVYVITSPTKQPITLVFEDFQVEYDTDCKDDYVSVKDGVNKSLGSFCGYKNPPPLLALSGVFIIKFHSDRYVNYKGFLAIFNDSQECVYINKDVSGSIKSPNFPAMYPTNSICLYYIQSLNQMPINSTFTHFDLEKTISGTCDNDYIIIQDGISKSARRLGKFCGDQIPLIPVVFSGTIFVIFKSDNLTSMSGFKAEYKEEAILDCSGYLNVSAGRIQSPNYPEHYSINTDCEYMIAIPYNGSINLTFIEFELERKSDCTYDFVEIYDSNNYIGKFCGTQIPVLPLSLSSSIRILFHSDDSNTFKGFYAIFSQVTAYAQIKVYVQTEGKVELRCPQPSSSSSITWFGPQIVSPISKGKKIYWNTEDNRISISGNQSIGQYNLQIIRIKTSDLGIYRCSVNIEDISYQQEFSVNIGKPPQNLTILNAQNDNTLTGIEGTELILQCTVVSGMPQQLLEWIRNGETLTENRTDVLNFTFIPKHTDHLSQFTCKANSSTLNVLLVQSVTIIVFYFPRIYFNKKETSVKIKEGHPLTIECKGNGYPDPANYTWTKKTGLFWNLISKLPTLYINNVKRTHSGQYACGASNVVGTGRQEIVVLVMYAPDVDIQYRNYTDEITTRLLLCNATGIPSIYNFHDWEHTSDFGDHIRFLSGSRDGILYLPDNVKADKYQDNGYYKCTVDNTIPDIRGNIKKNAEVYLDVKGKPFFVIDNTNTVYGEYHQSLSVVVNIFSNPKYTTLEIFDQNGGDINSGPHLKVIEECISVIDTFHGTQVHVKGYRITIRLKNLTDEYFTEYTFNVMNAFGQSQHRLSVLQANPPDTPLIVALIPGANDVKIKWNTNFNGGFQQCFFIEYRDQDSTLWIEVQAFNTTSNAGVSWTVHNLKFGRSYVIRMFAKNIIGESNRTNEIMFVTMDGKPKHVLFYIILAGSASVIVLLIIVVTACTCKRHLRRSVKINSTQTYIIEEGQYEDIDEEQMTNIHDVETSGSCGIQETNIDSDYEQPIDSLGTENSVNHQQNISSSNSESSENDIDENHTFTKDVIVNSYEQLTDDPEPPLPYDELNQ